MHRAAGSQAGRMTAALPSPGRVLLWSAAGTALVYAVLWRAGAGNPDGFSPIFWYLLTAYDGHGNSLLLAVAACAFFLRRRAQALAVVKFTAERPWIVAAVAFPLLCAGSLLVYRDTALSMDEYAAVFQAHAFAAGKLAGVLPPELLDRLIPKLFQGYFFTLSRTTGEVSSNYWPGFALFLTPFVALDIPWAANPALGALTLPALHRLTQRVTGSRDAAGWAVALTAASPAFIVASISYYSMPAHLLFNLLYALLLLEVTVPRALLAGLIGSLALTLHNPVPHLLFALPFFVWLCVKPQSKTALLALVAGYLPLSLWLGVGWHYHLAALTHSTSPATAPTAAPALLETIAAQLSGLITLPGPGAVHARIAGLSKVWTWAAACMLVFAAYGYWAARRETGVKLLAAALATTLAGYFLVRFDQGHGWGYRYVHSAWFVIPVLAAIALGEERAGEERELRAMAAWALVLSALLSLGLRLVQVDDFISKHRNQVPPLARPADPQRPEIVFVKLASAPYARDMVQNDPFLRGSRVTMVYEGADRVADLMARRFPAYRKSAEGEWGELWTTTRAKRVN